MLNTMSYLNDDKFDDFNDRGIRLMFFLADIAISIPNNGFYYLGKWKNRTNSANI